MREGVREVGREKEGKMRGRAEVVSDTTDLPHAS